MFYRPPLPGNPPDQGSPEDMERRAQEIRGQELSEDTERSVQEIRGQKLSPQRVFYTVVGIALLLLLIVGILGANVFHFW